ncbi:hypothetical protein [Flavobacterium collinsii]|uniref:Uncharacterized protein n=1 Tax=Flavobacterium collinsii TaxID=1114861 RepID=A0A9W4X8P4_9FLAO|nr:hypothetical protein [Flavobacterium collinsii]CAI2765810.1 conserved membrane protein of unknown function [Flavobacterium collinsii]
MEKEFTYQQTLDLKNKLKAGTFKRELEFFNLIDQGYEPDQVKKILDNLLKSHKDDLFIEAKEAEKAKERDKISFAAVIIISALIGILGGNNGLMILVSVVAACMCGYWSSPENPIPAMTGYGIGAFLMPIFCAFYLKGRNSYFSIEILIPLLFSFGPGLLIKYLLSLLMPSDQE